jgi:hypothetical protein
MTVASFGGCGDLALNEVECAAPVKKLSYKLWALMDDEFDDFFIAKGAAGAKRILYMQVERVGFIEDRGDASLCVPGIAVFDGAFGNDGDGAVLRGLDCGAKACDARPDYQVVGRLLVRGNGVNINKIASEVRFVGHCVFTFG